MASSSFEAQYLQQMQQLILKKPNISNLPLFMTEEVEYCKACIQEAGPVKLSKKCGVLMMLVMLTSRLQQMRQTTE